MYPQPCTSQCRKMVRHTLKILVKVKAKVVIEAMVTIWLIVT